jgi:hypothetical protein
MNNIYNNTDYNNNKIKLTNNINRLASDYGFTYFVPSTINVYDLNKCYSQDSSNNIIMKDISNYQRNSQPVYHTNNSCKLNATILHSKQKLYEKNKIINIIKNGGLKQGLSFKIIDKYYNGNSKFFLNSNISYDDIAVKFDNLQNATNNKINTISTAYSIEWYGYFKPNMTGIWTFTLLTDNISLLWIGDIAINDYENLNAAINTKGSNTVSLNLNANKHYPIRIQYGNTSLTQSNKFTLTISSPKNDDGISMLCSLYNSDGSLFEKQLMYYSLNEVTPDLTIKGLFNCYVTDPNDNSNTVKQPSNDITKCDGIVNGVHFNKKDNKNMYLYRIEGDPKMNNLFMINNNDKNILHVPHNDTILTNSYIEYNDKYPLVTEQDKSTRLSQKDCNKKCDNDPNCKYFYSYTKNNTNYCITKNDDYFPNQLNPKQLNDNVKSSTLYVRNKVPKLSNTDARYNLNTINTNNYKSYSDYELIIDKELIIPDKHNIGYNGLNNEIKDQFIKNWEYINGTGSIKENFDNHNYNVPINSGNPGSNASIPDSIITNQINPLIKISQDYSELQKNVNDKYYDISNSIYKIKNNNNTGIRDILSNDPNNIYDYNGNLFKYNTKKPQKEDALKEDANIMILEQNNILMLGSITVAALLIGAVYFGK